MEWHDIQVIRWNAMDTWSSSTLQLLRNSGSLDTDTMSYSWSNEMKGFFCDNLTIRLSKLLKSKNQIGQLPSRVPCANDFAIGLQFPFDLKAGREHKFKSSAGISKNRHRLSFGCNLPLKLFFVVRHISIFTAWTKAGKLILLLLCLFASFCLILCVIMPSMYSRYFH